MNEKETKALNDINKEVKKGRDTTLLNKILTGIIAFLVAGFITALSLIAGHAVKEFKNMSDDMYTTYIRDTKEVILSFSEMEIANSWERLPVNEQREKLGNQYLTILQYYTVDIPENQKLNKKQLVKSFDTFFISINSFKSVNFFLPLAYMKVITNFNPNYVNDGRYGIAGLTQTQGSNTANLPTMRESDFFKIVFNGKDTLRNPDEAIKLLIARMDYLMKKFNNREEWVIWAMFDGEDRLIREFWENGNGAIPEKLYHETKVGEILDYYNLFKNWEIPKK